jgi:hypothetical protein
MDLAHIVLRLWRLRIWVGAAVVVSGVVAILATFHVSLSPLGLSQDKLTFGAASSEILVDSPKSSLADLSKDLQPLINRASIYADFLKSEPIKAEIARRAGIPVGGLLVRGQTELQAPATDKTASAYAAGDTGASGAFSVTFRQSPDSPILQIFTSAPTGKAAVRLADAAAAGVSAYIGRVQASDSVAEPYRVQVRQLGTATGGDVSTAPASKTTLLLGVVVFAILCALILVGSNLRSGLRSAKNLEGSLESLPRA